VFLPVWSFEPKDAFAMATTSDCVGDTVSVHIDRLNVRCSVLFRDLMFRPGLIYDQIQLAVTVGVQGFDTPDGLRQGNGVAFPGG
jgi:hypothetical protein